MNDRVINLHDGRPVNPQEDVCEHCAFSVFPTNEPVGTCRANPPVPLVVPQMQKDLASGREIMAPVLQAFFPPVERRSFCFAFEDRIDNIGD